MGCFFCPQGSGNSWDHADQGSGAALVEAIQTLALTSGESQLVNAPLYLVGDSQGGQFAFSFASWQPTRTLGFVSLKGGYHDWAAVQNATGVPGLFFAGESDAPFRLANIKEVFSKGRALGAPWCLAVEPSGGHSPEPCGSLVHSYLKELSKSPAAKGEGIAGTPAKIDVPPPTKDTSSWSWFPDAAFERDWSAFESQAPESSSSSLNFKSVEPSPQATAIPPSDNLGTIESGQKSQQFSLVVTPTKEAKWDNLNVIDCPYLSDVKAVKSSSTHFMVYADLSTSNLPLGRFTGVLPLRFKSHGNSILGGLNVPLTAMVTGDVTAIPSFILLKAAPDSVESTRVQIISKTKLPITLLTYQAAQGVRVESSSANAGSLELTVLFDVSNALPFGSASGSLLLHLKSDKEWVLRIPYISRN